MENIIDAATKRDKARRVLAFLASSGADTLVAFGAIGYQRLAEICHQRENRFFGRWVRL